MLRLFAITVLWFHQSGGCLESFDNEDQPAHFMDIILFVIMFIGFSFGYFLVCIDFIFILILKYILKW
ncbi:hypothetical protein LINGRAHAP2_LOCUS23378 [Linum grandiflorum]